MKSLILDCAKQYDQDVKSGNFPNEDEVFKLSPEEASILIAK
jgi:ketopantoate hydroxymethyltransferase